MADDTIDIVEPFDFHPCNSPRGMLYYDLNVLTDYQQTQLNDFKRELIRQNERYLASHPEIRALLSMVCRHVFRHRPRGNVQDFVGQFFLRPSSDLRSEMEQYIRGREPHVYEGDSAVIVRGESSEELSVEEEEVEETEDLTIFSRQMLDEILEKTLEKIGVDIFNKDDWDLQKAADAMTPGKSVVQDIISNILERTVPDGQREIMGYLKAMGDYGEGELSSFESEFEKEKNTEIDEIEETIKDTAAQAPDEELEPVKENKPDEIPNEINENPEIQQIDEIIGEPVNPEETALDETTE